MPGPTQDPLEDFAALLDGQTFASLTLALGAGSAGTLRKGDPSLVGKTSAGVLTIPTPCVFVNVDGGAPPVGVIGTARQSDFSCILEVYVRSSRDAVPAGRAIARAILAFLHHRQVADYVAVRAQSSEPFFRDKGHAENGIFLCPFRVEYHA